MHLNELNYKTSTWWLRNSYQINAIKYKINFVLRWRKDSSIMPFKLKQIFGRNMMMQRSSDGILRFKIYHTGLWFINPINLFYNSLNNFFHNKPVKHFPFFTSKSHGNMWCTAEDHWARIILDKISPLIPVNSFFFSSLKFNLVLINTLIFLLIPFKRDLNRVN